MPKIMIIEDESLLLQAIAKKLEVHKIETISCTAGEQALDYLKELNELPDLIWLDYHLREMSGLDFMHKLEELNLSKNIPIVIVSNSASDEKIHSMLALGAKSYILKARHTLNDIVEHVKQFIDTERAETLLNLSE